jgi:ABC-2 type transport system permease protein
MTAYFDVYRQLMKIGVMAEIQYRVSTYFYMIGMITEPVIYLVVWSTIARSHGGSVGGYTAGQFVAYYIVWTLVRNVNIVFTPYGWEDRIRTGQFSAMLLRPMHPIHWDLAFFAGTRIMSVIMWLPLAAILVIAFRPTISPTWTQVLVFFFAIWGAYLIRSFNQWMLGLVTFWTTRVGAVFQLYITAETLLSGRLVPLSLMPHWVQVLADFLPFQWTFQFPILALIGKLTTRQLFLGLAAQLGWILGGIFLLQLVWAACLRKYSAVGN